MSSQNAKPGQNKEEVKVNQQAKNEALLTSYRNWTPQPENEIGREDRQKP